jgi:hypothetical protein
MFKHIFIYWSNVVDSPAILFKVNLWAYVNIRTFKLKLSNVLTYFILGLRNLKQKEIKVLYKDLTFESLYNFLFVYIFFFLLFFFFFI